MNIFETYRTLKNIQEATIVYKVKGIQKPEMDKFNTSAKLMKLKVSFKKQGSDTHVTMTGTKKQLRDFDAVARGKSSYGDPSTVQHFDESLEEAYRDGAGAKHKMKGLSIYGSEINGLKWKNGTYSAKAVVYGSNKLGFRVQNEFGDFETLDLKSFAKKFG